MKTMSSSFNSDDIFDESVEEEAIGEREWLKTKAGLLKEGFRDGVSEGQESFLQLGFNSGYQIASTKVFQLAKLRGEISAMLSFSHLKEDAALDSSKIDQLNQLIIDIRTVEDMFLKPDKSQLQNVRDIEGQGNYKQMRMEGQGYCNKSLLDSTKATNAESQTMEHKVSHDVKGCEDACDCVGDTDSQKHTCNQDCACNENDEVKIFDTENMDEVAKEIHRSPRETTQKASSSDALDDISEQALEQKHEHILLNCNLEWKVKEFRTRFKDIAVRSPETV